ncbi:SPX domain-containing protein [Cubamyces menziesii]|nr:SPX domain-containing protein [Cubamyces menziesii]
MHFSKTYSQLLLTLPPELRQSAIQYRQLKKIINQIVAELNALGLSPDILQNVVQPPPHAADKGKQREDSEQYTGPRIIYEFATVDDHVEPRLRLCLHSDDLPPSDAPGPSSSPLRSDVNIVLPISPDVIRTALGSAVSTDTPESSEGQPESSDTESALKPADAPSGELIIPLVSDTNFFRTLTEALNSLAAHLVTKRAEFETTLRSLSHDISSASRPSSSTSSFHPYSPFSSDPANISVSSHALAITSRSDLDTWRQIFQLYIEADIFQGHQERFRGEREIEDAETRLQTFNSELNERISKGALKLRMKQSRVALKTFMDLNTFILDLRKFQHVTAEATRKILKKHAKRTALPLAPDLTSPFIIRPDSQDRALVLSRSTMRSSETLSLSLLLVQALTETLLPIIPHIDDYSCVICTSLAFKPIRLRCSHLFCVRCLVKLQKRGEEHCPICRAPTVLSADRSNVDWALLNFMKDWFPVEAKKKLQQNEREAAEEEMQELGLDMKGCVVM